MSMGIESRYFGEGRSPMDLAYEDGQLARQRERQAEAREFRIALKIGFAYFLLVALVLMLVPRRWRPAPFSDAQRRSPIAQARAAAHMVVPIAFMR